MTEEQVIENKSNVKLILGGSAACVLVAGVIGFLIYSSICPCDRTPGGFLFGDSSDGQVNDWSFANNVELCQLQIYAGIRPHSINLNCMATPEGEMYLSCSVCDMKYWAAKVGENERGVMRLDGVVYPVYLNRITDSTCSPGMSTRSRHLRSYRGFSPRWRWPSRTSSSSSLEQ